MWKNAEYHVSKLAAICEITNLCVPSSPPRALLHLAEASG